MNNRSPRRLWLELTAVFAAKVIALTALYVFCFATPASPPDVGAHVFSVGDAK